jgi:adenylyltransferase/sulfurtransferase
MTTAQPPRERRTEAPFSFSSTTLDIAAHRGTLEDPAAGGYTSFEGWVRNHKEGHAVTRLEYEAFEALAVVEGTRIVDEAIARFGVIDARCVHRVGSLGIGDLAVWVGVSSRHRAEAFAACRFIIDEVKHRVPIWKKEHYVNGDSGWVNCERCAEAASPKEALPSTTCTHEHFPTLAHASRLAPHASHLTPHASPDYSRQISLRDVGAAGQAKLRSARVLVIGAGGLGVPVLNYLAGAGVGTIGIAEADVLDASNLHRQPLYALEDVGKPKSALAAARLQALNSDVHIATHERITAQNAVDLVGQYDLVIECSDNFATKFLVNDAVVKCARPAIFASVYQYEGQLQTYRPDVDSACLRCLWPEATRDGVVGNCQEAGVLGPVPGVLGTLQALEALKLLLDLPGQLRNELLLFDLLSLEPRKLKLVRRPDCRHDDSVRIESVATDLEVALTDLTAASVNGYALIDVREADEVAAMPISLASRHVPLAALLGDEGNLESAAQYLVICARGSRSRAAAEHLRSRGFHAWSLRGGLAAVRNEERTTT